MSSSPFKCRHQVPIALPVATGNRSPFEELITVLNAILTINNFNFFTGLFNFCYAILNLSLLTRFQRYCSALFLISEAF